MPQGRDVPELSDHEVKVLWITVGLMVTAIVIGIVLFIEGSQGVLLLILPAMQLAWLVVVVLPSFAYWVLLDGQGVRPARRLAARRWIAFHASGGLGAMS